MTDRPTCKTCRHWRVRSCGDFEPFEGFCSARPPVLLPSFTRGQWPLTGPNEGCGEHYPPLPAPPPWRCNADACDDTKPHVHIARFEDNGINTHEWIEKVYADELPSKPSKNACTCPRRLGIHERVEGFCI